MSNSLHKFLNGNIIQRHQLIIKNYSSKKEKRLFNFIRNIFLVVLGNRALTKHAVQYYFRRNSNNL